MIDQLVDKDFILLPISVSPRVCLRVIGRIPTDIKKHYTGRANEIQALTPRFCCDELNAERLTRVIEVCAKDRALHGGCIAGEQGSEGEIT